MKNIFSIKTAAVVCVAVLAMSLGTQEASAQRCGGFGGGFGPGFGGGGISIGYTSGFRGAGFNNFGGFGPGLSINVGRSNFNRVPAFYGSSFNHYHARPVRYGYGYGHVPRHHTFHNSRWGW